MNISCGSGYSQGRHSRSTFGRAKRFSEALLSALPFLHIAIYVLVIIIGPELICVQ